MADSLFLDFLGRTSVLASLPQRDLKVLAGLLHRRFYQRGEVVFHRGDPGDVLHLVHRGRLKVVLQSAGGEQALLTIVGPGDLFGELALLDGQPRSATVVALEPAETATLGRLDFLDLVRRSPSAAERLLIALACIVRRSSEGVGDLMLVDLHGRVAKKLLELANSYGAAGAGPITIELPLTQEDLAAMVGATRASVNKVLGFYEDQGVLTRRHRHIVLLNVPVLRARATNDF
jgi:CRP/FNR family transcriptional regulator/CRP/FNR family cyclic AMP-dependent transcriptional regulator